MAATPLARTGGPLRPQAPQRHEWFGVERNSMPHMPLDTSIHWHWRNPLNIIPASLIAVVILDIVALVIKAFA